MGDGARGETGEWSQWSAAGGHGDSREGTVLSPESGGIWKEDREGTHGTDGVEQ